MTSHLAYLSDRAYIYFNFPLVDTSNLFILFYFLFGLSDMSLVRTCGHGGHRGHLRNITATLRPQEYPFQHL